MAERGMFAPPGMARPGRIIWTAVRYPSPGPCLSYHAMPGMARPPVQLLRIQSRSVIQPVMPPGMQPGMPPGMQPGMPPGMQLGMQPGMPPGMQTGMPPVMPPLPMGMMQHGSELFEMESAVPSQTVVGTSYDDSWQESDEWAPGDDETDSDPGAATPGGAAESPEVSQSDVSVRSVSVSDTTASPRAKDSTEQNDDSFTVSLSDVNLKFIIDNHGNPKKPSDARPKKKENETVARPKKKETKDDKTKKSESKENETKSKDAEAKTKKSKDAEAKKDESKDDNAIKNVDKASKDEENDKTGDKKNKKRKKKKRKRKRCSRCYLM